jgi:hypothetical protein
MPLEEFDEETFVAFTDISGFKDMMKDNGDQAVEAMRFLYSIGYDVLQVRPSVSGLFVSDCGVLFSRDGSKSRKLTEMLDVVKQINARFLEKRLMLTTSIAWGHFSYHEMIAFNGIQKNPIYGNGYLGAFLDNWAGKPKIQPGECRILKKNMDEIPQDVHTPFLRETRDHYQFFWNVNAPEEIPEFQRRYNDSYSLKYAGMLSALRGGMS